MAGTRDAIWQCSESFELSEVSLPDSDSEFDEPTPEVVTRERVKQTIHC